jgi:hypothetical protein
MESFYSDILQSRIIGSETYYKRGVYTVCPTIKIHAYKDYRGFKRYTLTINGTIVSAVELDRTNTIARMATSPEHSGQRLNKQLRAFIQHIIKERIYIFESELSELGRKSLESRIQFDRNNTI